MSKVSVFDYGWIDLVFEGRNQQYGAYQLRRQDARTTMVALFSGIALIGALVAVPAVANYFAAHKADSVPTELPPVILIDDAVVIPEQVKPRVQPQSGGETVAKSTQPTIEFKPLAPTTAPVDKTPPTTVDVLTTNAGQVTDSGTGENTIVTGPTAPDGIPGGKGNALTNTGTEGTFITTALDVTPDFPGGMKKFYEYVGNNFRTPEGMAASTMKVYVTFIIEKDGSMTDIKVPRDPGYGLANEAIRVLKSLKTKWKPGIKNGHPVRTAYNLPITVQVH